MMYLYARLVAVLLIVAPLTAPASAQTSMHLSKVEDPILLKAVEKSLQTKLLAEDGSADDWFGASVALDGDFALVGAYKHDGRGGASGAAYVFVRSGDTWTQQAKLLPTDVAEGDFFGRSVSLDDNYALVGAPGDDDQGESSGSAYVFVRSDGTWTLQAKLLPGEDSAYLDFGTAVAIDGNQALIGAVGDYGLVGTYGAGSAYVFVRSGDTWTQQAKLLATDGAEYDNFGTSVSLDGNYALIGADQESRDAGSAYVFVRADGMWTQQARLFPSESAAQDGFGRSVSLDGGYALIGTGTHSAYVFVRTGSAWTEQARLLPEDSPTSNHFGAAVSLDGDQALLGAQSDRGRVGAYASGAAYVFARSDDTWTQQAKLLPSDGDTSDNFGWSVSLDGEVALVGSIGDDDQGSSSGAAHVLEIVSEFVADSAIEFMGTPEGETTIDTIRVSNPGTRTLFVNEIASTNDAFAAIPNSFEVVSGDTVGIAVAFSPPAAGTFEGELIFMHNGASSPNAVAVTGSGHGAVSISPSPLVFPEIAVDSTTAQWLTVGNSASVDLTVTDVTSTDAAFSVESSAFTVPVNGEAMLEVTFTPSFSGTASGLLILTHNGAGSRDTVRVSGTARGPEIQVDKELMFIPTEVYDVQNRIVVVQSIGLQPLVVSSAEVVDSDTGAPASAFYIDRTAFEVPPADEMTPGTYSLAVYFSPDTLGVHEAELRLHHNAGSEPATVQLSGTGAMPGIKLAAFRETAETSPPSFVTVAFMATDEQGRGLPFLDQTGYYDIVDQTLGDPSSAIDVDQDEEAIPQVKDFGTVPFTIKTVLMLDNSSSIGTDLTAVKNAARSFVRQMLPQQEVALYTFSEEITLRQDFTQDTTALMNGIDAIRLGPNSTNLYGAVIEGAGAWEDYFQVTGPETRFELGTMLVLSDGQDTQGASSLSAAQAAIANKEVITVAVGADAQSALPALHTASFVSPVAVHNFDGLTEAFADVQRELVRLSNSLYWLTYASPRRGDIARTLAVSLKENPYTGPEASFTVTYSSEGFGPLNPGIYVNRSARALDGVDTLKVRANLDTLVTAEVLLMDNPLLEWEPADPSILSIEPINANATEVRLHYSGEEGSATSVTITDLANEAFYAGATKTLTIVPLPTVSNEEPNQELPQELSLAQNYPNPFNPQTTIPFSLDRSQRVRLSIVDLLGREVAVLVDGPRSRGEHTVAFEASGLPSGQYFYRLEADGQIRTKQMHLLK